MIWRTGVNPYPKSAIFRSSLRSGERAWRAFVEKNAPHEVAARRAHELFDHTPLQNHRIGEALALFRIYRDILPSLEERVGPCSILGETECLGVFRNGDGTYAVVTSLADFYIVQYQEDTVRLLWQIEEGHGFERQIYRRDASFFLNYGRILRLSDERMFSVDHSDMEHGHFTRMRIKNGQPPPPGEYELPLEGRQAKSEYYWVNRQPLTYREFPLGFRHEELLRFERVFENRRPKPRFDEIPDILARLKGRFGSKEMIFRNFGTEG